MSAAIRLASSGEIAEGLLHDEREQEDVSIVLVSTAPPAPISTALQSLRVMGREGNMVSIGELVRADLVTEDKSIYRKNLMPVVYVTGGRRRRNREPCYAMLKLGPGARTDASSRKVTRSNSTLRRNRFARTATR